MPALGCCPRPDLLPSLSHPVWFYFGVVGSFTFLLIQLLLLIRLCALLEPAVAVQGRGVTPRLVCRSSATRGLVQG